MGSSLPFDLILEILQRTPAESLLRFKSTCKKWYELISNDKRFMYKHLDKSTKRFLRIENRERVQILDPVTEILAVSTIPNELRHKLSLLQQNEATREIHVSVTNKLSDEVVSFSRYFSVTLPDIPLFRSIDILPLPGCFIGKNRNIIAWCEQLVGKYDDHTSIILYEIGEGGVTKRIRTGRHEADEDYNDLDNCSYVYVPSLIPVPE
ncbi:unnamed protein product [Arabidopsis thaliana]|uniref:(thale cress) hypothetical protein n=1 Tax=Arabidopsis thaliana TaxID=3702 RepID=A0A7G2ENR5_ARATH|nr:unnamed protein product [Arabidopsis thaliana]